MSAALSVRTCVVLNSMPGRSSTVTEIAWFAIACGILSGYYQPTGLTPCVFYALADACFRSSASSVACAVARPRAPVRRLRAQLDEDWKYWMTQYPELATALRLSGPERAVDRLLPGRDRRARRLPEGERQPAVGAIDRASLSPRTIS